MISLPDVLKQIEEKDHLNVKAIFSLTFLKANRDEKTGGQWVKLEKASSCGLPPNCRGHEMRGIKCLETGKPYAVHNRLIFQYNNQNIYWP